MTAAATMRALLAADATFMADVPGGLLASPLETDTPGAWTPDPATQVPVLQPCAVLLDVNAVPFPQGGSSHWQIPADEWPQLTFYAEPADVAQIEAAEAQAMTVLHGAEADGYTILATATRLRQMTAVELPGQIQTFARRFRATNLRHFTPV